MISFLLLLLALCSWPAWYGKVFGLESGEPRGERLLRWVQCAALLFLAAAFAAGPTPFLRVVSLFALAGVGAELAFRALVKYAFPALGRIVPAIGKVHQYLVENPENLYYSRYVPHPFLQYTGPREPVPESADDFFLGFKKLKVSDIAKPAGVVRVACLGGSTTEDGFPELLQEFLDREARGPRFQVLNFGTTWWSSIHSTVNFVLNVIDFRPDFVVVHDNCNDHHYRGYAGFRGDGAHAYRVFVAPPSPDETIYRFSLLYRFLKTALVAVWPQAFRPKLGIADIGLKPGKSLQYRPDELRVFERNMNTICTLARERGSRVLLTTMPYSQVKTYGTDHDAAYRPHLQQTNDILRRAAADGGHVLVDLDPVMTGKEEFFLDPVHVTAAGNRIKAEEIGRALLREPATRS